MLSKEEIEFCSSLEKMFNYLKTKKELSKFEILVIINFDYITKKVLSNECKTAIEIVSKNMYYELVKRKEECYEKQIDQLESDKQKLIKKLEEKIKNNKARTDCTFCNNTCNSYTTCKVCQEILEIVKGEKK